MKSQLYLIVYFIVLLSIHITYILWFFNDIGFICFPTWKKPAKGKQSPRATWKASEKLSFGWSGHTKTSGKRFRITKKFAKRVVSTKLQWLILQQNSIRTCLLLCSRNSGDSWSQIKTNLSDRRGNSLRNRSLNRTSCG